MVALGEGGGGERQMSVAMKQGGECRWEEFSRRRKVCIISAGVCCVCEGVVAVYSVNDSAASVCGVPVCVHTCSTSRKCPEKAFEHL